MVPSAMRRLDVDRLVRLRQGLEGLHGKLGGRERLRVEPAGDVVALAAGILIALGGGEREPLVGSARFCSTPMPRALRMPRLYWLSATPRSAALRNHSDAVR